MNQATLLPFARASLSLTIIFLLASGATATETTVVAEGQYVMATATRWQLRKKGPTCPAQSC
jgi:hypothetical protein